MDPLFFFLLGHIIGDYALQTDAMGANKRKINGSLILHAAIYTLTIAVLAFIHDLLYPPSIFLVMLPWMIPVFALHISQDFIKGRYFNKSRQCYYIDQSLHLVALFALRIIVGG